MAKFKVDWNNNCPDDLAMVITALLAYSLGCAGYTIWGPSAWYWNLLKAQLPLALTFGVFGLLYIPIWTINFVDAVIQWLRRK